MLHISEHFGPTIQGEGISAGVPSYFIRLQNCNLMCGGHNGCLVKEGKATWWCDSEVVWKQGKQTTNEELEQAFKDSGELENIIKGTTHLIWTGGEPMLPRNQKAIAGFLKYFENKYNCSVFNEIETNGTIIGEDCFYENYIDQINCSPKLSNSGMGKSMRIVPDAIRQIIAHGNCCWKFVISDDEDFKEIEEDFIIPFHLDKKDIILMPGCDNVNDLPEATRVVWELATKYNVKCCTRLQILAYNKTIGV